MEYAVSWRDRAACAGYPTAMFYPAGDNRAGREAALTVCRRCPVRQACADDALAVPTEVDYGIRGGLTANDRAALRDRKPARRRWR